MTTLYLRNVPDDIKHSVKVEAARRRQTLTEFIVHAVESELRRSEHEVRSEDPA